MSIDNVIRKSVAQAVPESRDKLHLPSKLPLCAKYSIFGQYLSPGHCQPTHQPPEGVYLRKV